MRRQFSTMMTEPSTMSPKSIATGIMRLRLILLCTIAAYLALYHARCSQQHRQWNGQRRNDRRPDVPQQQKQNDDDKKRALGQVLLDCPDRVVHQRRSVQHGLGLDIWRE